MIPEIQPNEVHLNPTLYTIIDVRTSQEFSGELGHIDGATLHTLDSLGEKIKTIPTTKPIVFVCRSGARSGQAAAYAQSIGIGNCFNMVGGMLLWNDLKLPVRKS